LTRYRNSLTVFLNVDTLLMEVLRLEVLIFIAQLKIKTVSL
jgi:hypothetical protein